ncbi:MAG: TorF family putative porin [Steroidobacteraceae bacterium]
MKLSHGMAAIVLAGAGATANAGEFSATVTGVTDYDFRGVTQTAQGPALQGSLDFAADTGFYAGVWASNVDWGPGDPNLEVDVYGGWGGGEDVTWDLGLVYYTYSGAGSSNYPEAYASLGWKWFEAKAWYAWDYAGIDGKNEHYYEGNATYELPANFGLVGHIGYSNGDGIKAAFGQSSYYDWSVGVTYTWGHFDMSLKWVDGDDLKTYQQTKNDIFSSEARAIFQVSTTFPWKKDE